MPPGPKAHALAARTPTHSAAGRNFPGHVLVRIRAGTVRFHYFIGCVLLGLLPTMCWSMSRALQEDTRKVYRDADTGHCFTLVEWAIIVPKHRRN